MPLSEVLASNVPAGRMLDVLDPDMSSKSSPASKSTVTDSKGSFHVKVKSVVGSRACASVKTVPVKKGVVGAQNF